MAVPSSLLPISAVLALGGISGVGSGLAAQQAKRFQDAQFAEQQAQQNIANEMAAEQQRKQAEAASQANQIQTALAYDRLNQEQQQSADKLAADKAQAEAQNLLATSRENQSAQQFKQRNAVDQAQQNLAEQKFSTEQTQKTSQEAAVNDMIDQLGLPSQEAQRLKLQYKATGRLPAPAGESDARNLNALTIARKTLVDPYGEPLPGKENDLTAIDQQIASIVRGVGGQTGGIQPANTAPVATPQITVQPTGKTTPEGIPLAHVTAQTPQGPKTAELPAPATPADAMKLPKGVTYVTPDGQIFTR